MYALFNALFLIFKVENVVRIMVVRIGLRWTRQFHVLPL